MKAAIVVAFLSAVFLTGCSATKPCKVTPPPAPAIKAAPVVETPAPVEAPKPVVVEQKAGPVPTVPPTPDYKAMFAAQVNDVYFGFDKSVILGESQSVLASDVAFLKSNPNILFSITSSCDVVGSDAYNDGLGQRRLAAVSKALVAAGIDATRFNGASLGKTSSYCSAKSCQQLNRRVHFAYSGTR